MKVTLEKEVRLESAVAYLRFEKDVKRQDIQDYLNGKHFRDNLIENRVKEYLKNIGVFDEKYQLTKLGNSVRESGILPTAEEGKYRIWFTQQDSHFGNRVLYFKRVQPHGSNEGKLDLELDNDGHYYLPTKENDFGKLKLLSEREYFGKRLRGRTQLSLRWSWQGVESSEYVFNGKIDDGKSNISVASKGIPCEENLNDYIQQIFPDWDSKNQRLKVSFGGLVDESRSSFTFDGELPWREFSVEVQGLPLMPDSKQDAKEWRNWLVKEELKQDFLDARDFERVVVKTNEQPAFSFFRSDLDCPKPQQFSSTVEDDTLAFWHLNAASDLNPNAKTKLPDKPVQLKKGLELTFNEIVSLLNLVDFDGNSILIYYDKYVIKKHQQESAAAFLNAVNAQRRTVITDLKHENSSDYLRKYKPQINLIDLQGVFRSKPPHDRYIIVGNNKKIGVWTVSNSIDYIRFDAGEIDGDSKGTITQSVVFTPVESEMVGKDLLNLLKNDLSDEQ